MIERYTIHRTTGDNASIVARVETNLGLCFIFLLAPTVEERRIPLLIQTLVDLEIRGDKIKRGKRK